MLLALPPVVLKQFSEVFVFSAGRLEVESLILDTHSLVIQQILKTADALFKLLTIGARFFSKFC